MQFFLFPRKSFPGLFTVQLRIRSAKGRRNPPAAAWIWLFLMVLQSLIPPILMETRNLLKDRGAIRHFGASNWSLARFIEANQYAADRGLEGFTSVSPCYSPAAQIGDPSGHSVCISGPSGKSAREWYQEHSITVFSYSGLARGFLSGRFRSDGSVSAEDVLSPTCRQEYCYPENIELLRRAEQIAAQKGATVAQVSLAWLLEQPMRPFPIISPTSEAHILDAVRAFSVHLTPEEQEQLTL